MYGRIEARAWHADKIGGTNESEERKVDARDTRRETFVKRMIVCTVVTIQLGMYTSCFVF